MRDLVRFGLSKTCLKVTKIMKYIVMFLAALSVTTTGRATDKPVTS